MMRWGSACAALLLIAIAACTPGVDESELGHSSAYAVSPSPDPDPDPPTDPGVSGSIYPGCEETQPLQPFERVPRNAGTAALQGKDAVGFTTGGRGAEIP